jgi:hypothetical protein
LFKFGPIITRVQSALGSGLGGLTIGSGSTVYIYGQGFSGSGLQLTANGMPLAISSSSDQLITAYLPGGYNGLVKLGVSNSNGQHTLNIMTATTAAPTIPVVTGTSPPAGSGVSQTFTFTFSDAAGYQDLSVVNVLINSALDGRHACYVAFTPSGPSSGSVLLVDDEGDAGGPFQSLTLPGGGTVNNSQCSITGARSAATSSGNTLALTLAFTFTSGFSGSKVVYAAARNISANSSGWEALGTWTVPGPASTGPTVGGVSPPRSDSLGPTTYTFTFSDSNGWQDIAVVNVLTNSSLDGRHACYLAFVPSGASAGSLFLVDDAGDAGGAFSTIVLPSGGSVSNAQCSIYGAGSLVSGSGNTLTITLVIKFQQSFTGNQIFYLAARNNSLNSNWQPVGSVTIT